MSQHEPVSTPSPEASATEPATTAAVTRRRFLTLGLVGGAALAGSNAVTGVVTHRLTQQADDEEMASVMADYEGQIESVRGELQARITRLEQQLAIYHAMDRLGLDNLINLFLDIYDRFWATLRTGLGALRRALGAARDVLSRLELGLADLRTAAEVIGRLIGELDTRLDGVRQIINEVLKRTDPLRDAVSGFMAWLINRIPFGVGKQVLTAADRLTELAAALPSFLAETRTRLLAPLQAPESGADESQPLQGGLLDSIRSGLLAPLQTHLDDLDRMASRWDAEFAAPLRAALAERDQLRQELAKLELPSTTASEHQSQVELQCTHIYGRIYTF